LSRFQQVKPLFSNDPRDDAVDCEDDMSTLSVASTLH